MEHSCSQERTIGEITATMESICGTLHDMKQGQNEFILILKDIAQQGEQIKSLFHGAEKTDKNIRELFQRINQVEIKAAEERIKVGGIVAGVSIISASLTAWIIKIIKS